MRAVLVIGVVGVCAACGDAIFVGPALASFASLPWESRLEPYTGAAIAVESWSCADRQQGIVIDPGNPCTLDVNPRFTLDAAVTLSGAGCLEAVDGGFGAAPFSIDRDQTATGCSGTSLLARHPDRGALPVEAIDARVILRAGGDEIALDVDQGLGRFDLAPLDDVTAVRHGQVLRFRLPPGVEVSAADELEVASSWDEVIAAGERHRGFEVEGIDGDEFEIRVFDRSHGSPDPVETILQIALTAMSEQPVACDGVEACTLSVRHVWEVAVTLVQGEPS